MGRGGITLSARRSRTSQFPGIRLQQDSAFDWRSNALERSGELWIGSPIVHLEHKVQLAKRLLDYTKTHVGQIQDKAKINSYKTVTFTQTKTTNIYTNKVKFKKQNKVVSLF